MHKKLSALSTSVLLGFLLTGCAAKTPVQKEAKPETAVTVGEVRKNSCEASIEQAVQQARTTMRTAKKSCDEQKIEATPLWKKDYDGTVHLMIYDAAGKIILDELRKP